MSYMRGPVYVWDDGKRIHLWSADGADSWAESGWVEGHRERGIVSASGVAIDRKTFDEIVVMRAAELAAAGKYAKTQVRALKRHRGNGGCAALERFFEGKP